MASVRSSAKFIVLTGPPGKGKTTLVQRCCEGLKKAGLLTTGFYTEELREKGKRVGFDVMTLNGNRGPLARASDGGGAGRREYRVGQYEVCLQEFENTAIPVIKKREIGRAPVYVIDEVGKMELFSSSFVESVRRLLADPHTTIFTTIPIQKGRPIPLVEEIRNHPDARVFTVSRENRDSLVKEVVSAIQTSHEIYSIS